MLEVDILNYMNVTWVLIFFLQTAEVLVSHLQLSRQPRSNLQIMTRGPGHWGSIFNDWITMTTPRDSSGVWYFNI